VADEPRWKWLVFSGLTRREQQVLVFLILVAAAGLVYDQYKGASRRQALLLHRGGREVGAAAAKEPAVPAEGGGGRGVSTVRGPRDLVDINTATADQLAEDLPGIGPVRAEAIVRWREANGPFRRLEDLEKVRGIGEKTVEAIRPYVRPLGGEGRVAPARESVSNTGEIKQIRAKTPAPASRAPRGLVNINTASAEELATLDGIGPVLARRIVEYRNLHGPFPTAEAIQNVRGIGPTIYRRNRDRLTVGSGAGR